MRRRALSAAPSWSRVAPSVWAHGVDVGAPAAPRTTHRVFGGPAAFVPPRAFGYELPTSGVPEVAFAGRSNVGKSTLVGALLGDPALLGARRRRCTTPVNFFAVGRPGAPRRGGPRGAASDARAAAAKLFVVDLRASATRGRRAARGLWRRRARLPVVAAGRRPPPGLRPRRRAPRADPAVLESFSELRVPHRVVLTKCDRASAADVATALAATKDALDRPRRSSLLPVVHVVSAKTGFGVDDLRRHLADVVVDDAVG
ncbi:GTP binding protein [Aureococcus anophagefferens]|nr:GTP binding protein [Aureococcus anophagefferens]